MKEKQYLCTKANEGFIKNVADQYDVYCSGMEWFECNADAIAESTSYLYEGEISGKALCGKTVLNGGPQQSGFNGWESWLVCGTLKSNSDGVSFAVGTTYNLGTKVYTCAEKGWVEPSTYCSDTDWEDI